MDRLFETLKGLFANTPLASTVFLAYAIVGGISLALGSLVYGSYADNLLAIGIACGAIGVPRAIAKARAGVHQSTGVLAWIEKLPMPSIVFVVFVVASAVSLALQNIEYGQFTDNVLKVGIACGAIMVPRIVNRGDVPALTANHGTPPDQKGIGV